MSDLIENARSASYGIANLSSDEKNKILLIMASQLERNSSEIIEANLEDRSHISNLTKAIEDRLMLDEKRIGEMVETINKVASLPDPLEKEEDWSVTLGLKIRKVSVPLGVIGVIYENRPNVTIDIASLCIKSGNVCILRGSSTALNTNRALLKAIEPAIPEYAVSLIDSEDRKAIDIMLKARGKLDLLVPRGGTELINYVAENSRVPVIETGIGNCHIFVDETADLDMAEKIIINAKCQRPSVCNAAEKLLVHEKIATKLIPKIVKTLKEKKVELRGCEKTTKLIPDLVLATEEDWPKEYLDLIIAIKIVANIDEAIAHINKYNSKHTDAIITKNKINMEKFSRFVDSAVIIVNASTRFTDGGEFGFGTEVGISTQKLHARGPMGAKELTCTKYIVEGSGQIRG
ncbi:MAG: glutamate-5-semialdehyde dehydrogenase [Candidatus Micrarchaeota archaeon]